MLRNSVICKPTRIRNQIVAKNKQMTLVLFFVFLRLVSKMFLKTFKVFTLLQQMVNLTRVEKRQKQQPCPQRIFFFSKKKAKFFKIALGTRLFAQFFNTSTSLDQLKKSSLIKPRNNKRISTKCYSVPRHFTWFQKNFGPQFLHNIFGAHKHQNGTFIPLCLIEARNAKARNMDTKLVFSSTNGT